MKIITLVVTTLAIYAGASHAQDVGKVDYPYLGIQFTIPEGWTGREMEFGYLIGSNTEPGFVLLRTHEAATVEALKQEAQVGIVDDSGTNLQLAGEIESVTGQGIGAPMAGTVEFQSARAYVAAVINPFGQGVMVLAATDEQNYSKRYVQLAQEIANSLRFATPEEAPAVTEWKDSLKGAKLTYLNTTGGSDYSGYSGTSSRSEILLCANQQFSYYDSSSSSFDINAGFGSAHNSDSGQGAWKVSTGDDGSALLQLHFSDGREFEYRISYEERKTYLGDTRYFRTYDHGQC